MKIKNCPFCGSKGKVIKHKKLFYPLCSSKIEDDCLLYCGADSKDIWWETLSGYTNETNALNAWNRRKKDEYKTPI